MTSAKKIIEQTTDRTFPEVRPGVVARVNQEITETTPKGEEKKRIQTFEGIVLARKHGQGINATITVQKFSDNVAVEKIFPLYLPTIKSIEVVKKFKVRRAKLGFLKGQQRRMREIK
ncbi:50S ribosomal protein L19 [Candidatus Falkowbacteria bacterium]|nr:50S ribosomal protein L19 [Candidatus Falkowbacteria bacterium]